VFLFCTEQVRRLTGLTADPFFLQRITHIIYNFRPDLVTQIKTVQAVHHGTDFIVEVEIILSGSTPLAIAHNVGEELQRQLEKIPNVERAFVHLDFEIIHVPALEDIIV
jgi:divalent metal cation (Fe/Co/Zn/Cd) transporter